MMEDYVTLEELSAMTNIPKPELRDLSNSEQISKKEYAGEYLYPFEVFDELRNLGYVTSPRTSDVIAERSAPPEDEEVVVQPVVANIDSEGNLILSVEGDTHPEGSSELLGNGDVVEVDSTASSAAPVASILPVGLEGVAAVDTSTELPITSEDSSNEEVQEVKSTKRKGRNGGANAGKVLMHKPDDDGYKMVPISEVDTYVAQGWIRGRKPGTYKSTKGKLVVHDEFGNEKLIGREEAIPEGYVVGRGSKTRESISTSLVGRVWVHKGGDTKRIAKEELEKYLAEGYVQGRKDEADKRKNKKKEKENTESDVVEGQLTLDDVVTE